MNSPELLLLVENCPKGAETLVTRCLHSLTDKGAWGPAFYPLSHLLFPVSSGCAPLGSPVLGPHSVVKTI